MKTLVLGASTNPERYAYKAIEKLTAHKHELLALGFRPGEVLGHTIETEKQAWEGIDTVTLYLGPARQEAYFDYVISLRPRRVLFNPGSENPAFESLLQANGIHAERACTLVLLATNQY